MQYYTIILFIIFIVLSILFYYFSYNIYNQKILTNNENINKDIMQLKSDDIYNKLKFIKPQQISISGTINLKVLQETVKNLNIQYNNLINSKETETLLKNIEKIKENNNNILIQNNELNEILLSKNQILDSLIPNSNNMNTNFNNNLYSTILSFI